MSTLRTTNIIHGSSAISNIVLDNQGRAIFGPDSPAGRAALYVNAQNNRVGVNTESPAVALDVDGAINATGNVAFGGTLSVTGNVSFNGASLDLNSDLDLTGTLDVTGNSTFTGDVEITGDLTVDTNTLFVDASTNFVGVRNLSPIVDLHVLTSIRSDSGVANNYIDINANSGNKIFIRNYSTAGDAGGIKWFQRNAANTQFRYDKFTVDPDGGLQYYSRDGSDFDGSETPEFQVTRGGVLYVNFGDQPSLDGNTQIQLRGVNNNASIAMLRYDDTILSNNPIGRLLSFVPNDYAAQTTMLAGAFDITAAENHSDTQKGTKASISILRRGTTSQIQAFEAGDNYFFSRPLRCFTATKGVADPTVQTDLFNLNCRGHASCTVQIQVTDPNYQNYSVIGMLYIAWRGSGSNVSAATSVFEQKAGLLNGPGSVPTFSISAVRTSNTNIVIRGSANINYGSCEYSAIVYGNSSTNSLTAV